MIGVLVAVLLSILGRPLGFHVPGTDAYAGYATAGAGFLALAHTLKRGEHIRVTLLTSRLDGTAGRVVELWALSVAVVISGLFAWCALRNSLDSYRFNDMSTSSDATPMWIPQLTMVAGTAILFIAFVDEWVLEMQGKRPRRQAEEAHYE